MCRSTTGGAGRCRPLSQIRRGIGHPRAGRYPGNRQPGHLGTAAGNPHRASDGAENAAEYVVAHDRLIPHGVNGLNNALDSQTTRRQTEGPLLSFQAVVAAFRRFNADEDWALASHIALSTLMALFPFMIVMSSLAHFLGASEVADDVVGLMFDTWPQQVADRISSEIREILTTNRSNLLTINLVLATYFASSGVESLRIGLNRAYGVVEQRSWIVLRFKSIVYVLITAVALMTLGFLIVLGPLVFAVTAKYAPWIVPFEGRITFARYGIATSVLVVALLMVHMSLPAGRRRVKDVVPGIMITLGLWLLCSFIFGLYLAQLAESHFTYYSGLTSAMLALVFLYFIALIFLYGGELNHAITEVHGPRKNLNAHSLR